MIEASPAHADAERMGPLAIGCSLCGVFESNLLVEMQATQRQQSAFTVGRLVGWIVVYQVFLEETDSGFKSSES